ncbi:MAG: hypothetical protein U0167_04080 [bacterium]
MKLVLGKWTVHDQGGSLCLGPEENGGFTARDCDAVPRTAYDPVVTGFSSNGVPCNVGQQGCSESAPGTVVFEETATAPGRLAYGQPWSPDGSWVAVTARDGTTTLVAPTGGATRNLKVPAGEIRWSPDGSCAVYVYRIGRRDPHAKTLAVTRASDGSTRVLATGDDFTHQIWTGDGRPHSLMGDGTLRSFARPDIWQPPEAYLPPHHDALVSVTMPRGAHNTIRRFSLDTARESTFVARDLPAGNELLLQASGARLPVALVQVYPTATFPGRTVLLSVPTGETLLEFTPLLSDTDPGFFGTSLAHDDQWIVGQVAHSSDGHRYDRSEIWVASRTGRWLRMLGGATMGTDPQCPAHGDWLAFNELTSDLVHIGRLRVTP